VAVIDWYSMYVLSWKISYSMDTSFAFCNNDRIHQSLDYKTPAESYFPKLKERRKVA
jgi:hypothetical protein